MRDLQWMTNAHNHKVNSTDKRIVQSLIKPFGDFNNLSVSVTILLFTVMSKLSSPYKRVLRVNGAMLTSYNSCCIYVVERILIKEK